MTAIMNAVGDGSRCFKSISIVRNWYIIELASFEGRIAGANVPYATA